MRALLLLFLCNVALLNGQKTLQLTEGQNSPNATLEQVSWIEGHWRGEAFGGTTEEIWSPPMGDTMMFAFRLIHEGRVSFYEIGHIREAENSLLLQLKHFDGNLKGWETKEETVDFKLVKLDKNTIYFEGFTFEKVNDNEINIFVVVGDDGKSEEVKFNYKRY